MKIEYIYEAGVFGSYKKANAQSNIDNAKRDLAKVAQKSIIESKCDELAELYLDMLTEVNSQTTTISSKYNYKSAIGETYYVISELSNYVINRYFTGRKMQLNIIKNVYCNRLAIEYMVSQGCFILPLVDITNTWQIFHDYKDVISYKNMIKSIADAAENVIKSHLSKFPSYASTIPNKVKIVILQIYNVEEELLSYMGITDKCDFEYPVGQGNSCLNYILNNCATIHYQCNINPVKTDEPIWKAIAEPSPWMFNKIIVMGIISDLPTVSADNFYSIKLLKFALDKGLLDKTFSRFVINIDKKNTKSLKTLKQEVYNNGLDEYVIYRKTIRQKH